jgi:integrase
VPDDVRSGAFFGGKEHYQASLKTTELHEAKVRALSIGLRFDAEVANLRAGSLKALMLKPGVEFVLTDEALEAIQWRWWSSALSRDKELRGIAEANPDGDWAHHMDGEDDHRHALLGALADPSTGREAMIKLKRDLAVEWSGFIDAEARRLGVSAGSPEHRRVEAAIVKAEIDVIQGRHLAWLGREIEPTTKSVARGMARNLKPQSNWTITHLTNHILDFFPKRASWHHKVTAQVVPLFVSHLGRPRAISEVTRDDIRSFVERLRQCPTNAAQRFPGKSLADAIALNKQRDQPYATLSPNTIRDTHFAVLRAAFGYAVGEGWLEGSPTDRVKVTGSTKKGGQRPSFKEEELSALFDLPVFTGCKSSAQYGVIGEVILDDHRFWAPLLMLFTGIRPSELGQLAVTDVKLSRIPFISILTEFDPNDPDDKPFYMTFKTSNARREVPIHPMLLELGFGAYAVRMAASGNARLFPDWKASKDARKLYSGARWIRRFNEVFIPACTKRQPKPTFYSFRHTFKVAMATRGIDRAIQNQVLGHANVGMDAYYYDAVSLDELHEQISRVSYKHLDLSRFVERAKSYQS